MAPGIENCMYCEYGEANDIEHFWPKSQYPHKAYEWPNLLLACSNCNSNHKRDQFPVDAAGNSLLIDPTAEDPREHLEFLPLSGKYEAITPKGEQSILVFGLARETLERARQDAWIRLQALLIAYAVVRQAEELQSAEDIRTVVCSHPFGSLFIRMLEIATKPFADHLMNSLCLDAIRRHPEVTEWL
jgi:uncharacterized protein (TIGR02646 family)